MKIFFFHLNEAHNYITHDANELANYINYMKCHKILKILRYNTNSQGNKRGRISLKLKLKLN